MHCSVEPISWQLPIPFTRLNGDQIAMQILTAAALTKSDQIPPAPKPTRASAEALRKRGLEKFKDILTLGRG